MKYIFDNREGDKEIIDGYVNELSQKNRQELVDCYNREVKIGIVGVRRQSLYLCALRIVFGQVFGDSPIGLENGVVLDLKGRIILAGDRLIYLENYNPN
jgi:hypothetical protein